MKLNKNINNYLKMKEITKTIQIIKKKQIQFSQHGQRDQMLERKIAQNFTNLPKK